LNIVVYMDSLRHASLLRTNMAEMIIYRITLYVVMLTILVDIVLAGFRVSAGCCCLRLQPGIP